MTRTGRGSTRSGLPAALPSGSYAAPAPVRQHLSGGLTVAFHGDDNRRADYDVGTLPLPRWHEPLAAALAERIGPQGELRALTSARNIWQAVGRLIRFLDQRPRPPAEPADLRVADIEAFYRHRGRDNEYLALADLRDVRSVLRESPIRDRFTPDVVDFLQQRLPTRRATEGEPGYSEGELTRLVSAARADVATIRARVQAGEDLLARFEREPASVSGEDRDLAVTLAGMAATGVVPPMPGWHAVTLPRRIALASHLLLTFRDLAPLLVLLAAVTARNGETLKELPAAHRILDGLAVELQVVKRRRGRRRWFETVTWEIGRPGRELHTPGGLYLLLLRLTERSRTLCGSPLAVCVWGNGHRNGTVGTVAEHTAVFEASLHGRDIELSGWAVGREHPVLADPPPPPAAAGSGDAGEPGDDAGLVDPPPLEVSFNRIKTSVDVRRTKQLGGHLPSAARSNTAQVLFQNYLKSDPTVIDWAQEIIGEAVAEAERAALDAHQRALNNAGGALRVVAGPVDAGRLEEAGLDPQTAQAAVDGSLDTAWTGCTDHDRHPTTGTTCANSFLACFHCGNCLVTADHLPRLLDLLDALNDRRLRVSEADWWNDYGPTWAAITIDVLPKFSPEELEHAERDKTFDAFLDLVQAPWEQP